MVMYYSFVVLHVLVSIILILVVLLQSGKGGDLAGAFGGGGSQTAFGSRGPASFLSKVTTGAAVLFMVTSIALSGMSNRSAGTSVLETTPPPAATAPAPQPKAAPPAQKGQAPAQQQKAGGSEGSSQATQPPAGQKP